MTGNTQHHYNKPKIVQAYRDRYKGIKGWYFDKNETRLVMRNLESVTKGKIVLDLGMGAGRLIPAIQKKKLKYVGLDYSYNLVKSAKEDHPTEDSLIVGSALSLPFNDEVFDCIVSIGLFESINEIDDVMNESWRVLKPNGRFVFTAYNKDSWLGGEIIGSEYKIKTFKHGDLIYFLEKHGWNNVRVESTFHMPNRFLWKVVGRLYRFKLPILGGLYIYIYSFFQALICKLDFNKNKGVELVVTCEKIKASDRISVNPPL